MASSRTRSVKENPTRATATWIPRQRHRRRASTQPSRVSYSGRHAGCARSPSECWPGRWVSRPSRFRGHHTHLPCVFFFRPGFWGRRSRPTILSSRARKRSLSTGRPVASCRMPPPALPKAHPAGVSPVGLADRPSQTVRRVRHHDSCHPRHSRTLPRPGPTVNMSMMTPQILSPEVLEISDVPFRRAGSP